MHLILQRGFLSVRPRFRNFQLVRSTCRGAVPSSVGQLSEIDVDFNELPLGVGACGAVYSGKHHETLRDVAVKVMSPNLSVAGESSSDEVANAIKQERRAVAQILHLNDSHPHVVDYMGSFEGPIDEATDSGLNTYNLPAEDSIQYFVMERLSGELLQDRIQAVGQFHEDEARQVTRSVLKGLQFLHQRGIVHRDICPRNILYAHPDAEVSECKIIDFSHAGVLPTDSSLDDACFDRHTGSSGFLAPEVLIGKERYSAKCDLYSLGCTVHAMMAGGKLPRRHPRLGILTCLPESMSANGRDFVQLLLSADPIERPSVKDALRHPWFL